jgi:hypothetical protein
MPKNIFKNLPTDKHKKWKDMVFAKLGEVMQSYVQSQQYTFDTISGCRDSKMRKLLLSEINRMSQKITKQVVADHPNLDAGMVKRHFKAFVKDDCQIIGTRYNWTHLHRVLLKEPAQ